MNLLLIKVLLLAMLPFAAAHGRSLRGLVLAATDSTEATTENTTKFAYIDGIRIRFLANAAYGLHEMQKVDFFWPDEVDPQDGWPVVVGFHGSGGTKEGQHGFCKQMMKESAFTRACMPVEFRNEGYTFPDKEKDAIKAVKWLVSNAAKYQINEKSIMLYGHSLGGMLANSIVWNQQGFTSDHVSAAVFSAGVGGFIVEKARAGHPPLLVISSEDDPMVKYKHSKAFFDKLKPLGGIVHLLKYYKSGHRPMAEPSFHSEIGAFLDSPATYEAPDPNKCKAACFKNTADWSLKCSWSMCGTCDECGDITTTTTLTVEEEAARKYIQLAGHGWCQGPGQLFDESGTFSLNACKLLCDETATCSSIVHKHDGSRCVGFSNDCSERDGNQFVVPYTVQEEQVA